MAWLSKEQPSPFDSLPIPGLYFLAGDLVAKKWKIDLTKGEKLSMIVFPSGAACELWESSDPQGGTVHIFGELDLPLRDSREHAYHRAADIAEQVGYLAAKVGETQIEVWGHDSGEHALITYDDLTRLMVNVNFVQRATHQERPRQPLLDAESLKRLSPLYSGEKLGLNALAQVRFFTPDANWTWYASEFDGENLFFGLVIGLETELGYFSLSDLESIRGPSGLPIERDRFFEPKTLHELKTMHERTWRRKE
jgi:hypothetical protein